MARPKSKDLYHQELRLLRKAVEQLVTEVHSLRLYHEKKDKIIVDFFLDIEKKTGLLEKLMASGWKPERSRG